MAMEGKSKLRTEDFLQLKRAGKKAAKTDIAVSEKIAVEGIHCDGAQLKCFVQGMDKHGDGLR